MLHVPGHELQVVDEGGRVLPLRLEVRNGDKRFATINIKTYQMKGAPGATN